MRALRWLLGIVAILAVVVVLAIAAGAVWLNTFIHSDAFKHEVEARAGDALGGTVQIGSVNLDLLKGVKLEGLFYQIDPGHVNGPGTIQVKVASINCSYAWTELFNRRLQFTGVTLDQPQIVFTKEAAAAPLPPPENKPTPTTKESPEAAAKATSVPFQFALDRARVKDGSVSIRDANGISTVDLQGVNVEANTSGFTEGKDVTGKLTIATARFSPNLEVTSFSTALTGSRSSLKAEPIEASAYGGSLAGSYEFGHGDDLELNAKGIDVAQLTAATVSNSSAKLSGSLDVQSKWHNVTGALSGEGDALLTNGKLEGVRILEDLSGLLRVKELKEPIFSKAQSHFVVQDQSTQLTGLEIDSPIFQITGGGTIGFNGALKMDLVLILTRDAMKKMPKELAASFVQKQDGTGSIAFQVTGTTSDPQTDLPTRLLMQNTQIQNVINKALNKLFH